MTRTAAPRSFSHLLFPVWGFLCLPGEAPLDVPFVIMTSDDTHGKTLELLEEHSYFGMKAGSVHLLRTGGRPFAPVSIHQSLSVCPCVPVSPVFLSHLVDLCVTVSLCQCDNVPLCHCATVSLCHCVTLSLYHCISFCAMSDPL